MSLAIRIALIACCAAPAAHAQLFVNEILADNESVLADEAGEFDDWVEIYNAGPEAVALEGYALSDDPAEPDKFIFPAVSVEAGGYLLVWADGDPDQGPLHADFGLRAAGEEVALSRPDGAGGFELVDGFAFGEQAEDVSFGRAADGSDDFAIFLAPTPGAMNTDPVAGESPPSYATFDILYASPNPSSGAVSLALWSQGTFAVEGEVLDALGRTVVRVPASSVAPGSDRMRLALDLAPGAYTVRLRARLADGTVVPATQRLTVVR